MAKREVQHELILPFLETKNLISKCGKFSEFKIDVEDYVNIDFLKKITLQ